MVLEYFGQSRAFRDIATAMGDWVWETSADFKITYSSDRVREVLGYEPEDMLGQGPGDLLPPEEYERLLAENSSRECMVC